MAGNLLEGCFSLVPNKADCTVVKWGSCQGKRCVSSPVGIVEPHTSLLLWFPVALGIFLCYSISLLKWMALSREGVFGKYFTTVQELLVSFFIKSEFWVALWLAVWKLLTSLWYSDLIKSLLFLDICKGEVMLCSSLPLALFPASLPFQES